MFILNQHDLYIKCYVGHDLFTSLFFLKNILYQKKKKKVTLSILTTHFTTHTMYVTPIKASVNVEVAGPGPYTWAICKERKGNIG